MSPVLFENYGFHGLDAFLCFFFTQPPKFRTSKKPNVETPNVKTANVYQGDDDNDDDDDERVWPTYTKGVDTKALTAQTLKEKGRNIGKA